MRFPWSVLGLVLLLFGCDRRKEPGAVPTTEDAAPVSPHQDSDLKREIDFAYGLIPTNDPLSARNLPDYNTEGIIYEHHSFTDYLFSMINPEALQKYEGSYTAGEFKAQQEDQIPEYSLSSSWVLHNKQLPKAGITVSRNPATGRYEVSGGEVFLQEQGVGVSYEKDETTGETQTFLNFKRDF